MTAPRIPTTPRGNLALDISSGIANLLGGLRAEQERQRQMALQEALLKIRAAPSFQRTVVSTPEGPMHAAFDPATRQIELIRTPEGATIPSPEQQFFGVGQTPSGELTQFGIGRTRRPGVGPAPAETVPMPPGVQPRDIRPSPFVVETGEGPKIFGVDPRKGTATEIRTPEGRALVPKADEADERRARDAFEMVQSQAEMKDAVRRNPTAYNDAAKYIGAISISEPIPLAGNTIAQIIRQSQSVLSPEAAQYFSAFMNFAAARAFSRGGATLTRNEIDYALASLSPKPGESSQVSALRERLTRGVIGGSIRGNPAWERYRESARQFGFEEGLEDLAPPVEQPRRQSKYGYQR